MILKLEISRHLLEEELEAVGIRLNKSKPKIYFKPRKSGGLHINSMVQLTRLDDKLIHSILNEYSKQFISNNY